MFLTENIKWILTFVIKCIQVIRLVGGILGIFPPQNFFLRHTFLPENFTNAFRVLISWLVEWSMHQRTSFLLYKRFSSNIARRTNYCLIKGPNLINAYKKMNQFQRENSSNPKGKWISFKEKIIQIQRENESILKRK